MTTSNTSSDTTNPKEGHYDIFGEAEKESKAIVAVKEGRMRRTALHIRTFMDDVHNDRKPVTALDAVDDALRGKSSSSNNGVAVPNMDANAALQVVLASDKIPEGVRALIRRATVPTDPGHIPVGDDGTPLEITNLTKDNDDLKKAITTGPSSSDLSKIAQAARLDASASEQEIIDMILAWATAYDKGKDASNDVNDAFKAGRSATVGSGRVYSADQTKTLGENVKKLVEVFRPRSSS